MKLEALRYHKYKKPGKIQVVPTKETKTPKDLSLAYSPGVAEPCLEISSNSKLVYDYTNKGNLVAVITNGTAVLGLGNIGPEASKPVMEGKAVLFKIFADIDSFDIEINTEKVDEFVRAVELISPTFGGINLEDISAPACFEIEDKLTKSLSIPVMHDDQHGTAIVSAAALINAIELAGKNLSDIKLVMNGAGAASIACANLYLSIGLSKDNLLLFDSKGLISESRDDLNKYKLPFANSKFPKDLSLSDALEGADAFVGLSKADVITEDMVKSMAKNPIIFALANPNPEISYDLAMASRKDIIFATGRSDYPNQVNNVLGFPYIFRAALDVKATAINEAMKIAAVKAIAALVKQPITPELIDLYGIRELSFGPNYIIPKPFDKRLLPNISKAVAKAAIETGVATKTDFDLNTYFSNL